MLQKKQLPSPIIFTGFRPIRANHVVNTDMLEILRQLNAWLCPRLHDIMRKCFTRDLWEMRLFEFLQHLFRYLNQFRRLSQVGVKRIRAT